MKEKIHKVKLRVEYEHNVSEIREIAKITGCRGMSVTENLMDSSYDIEIISETYSGLYLATKHIKRYFKAEGIKTT